MRWLKTQFSDKILLDKYMKVKRMGTKDILRRVWLISANKMKPSKSICKQSSQTRTQLIKVTNNCRSTQHITLHSNMLY